MIDVTIVIPVYNTERYLSKAIESCLNQTLNNIEIIIINDGSTDNSLRIAQKYEAMYPTIKLITTENKGLSEARNKGLEEARGEYVYFLDSDDWIEPQTIEHCYKLADENKLDMILFDTKAEVESSIESLISINDDYCKRDHIVNPNIVYMGRQFIELYADKGKAFVQAWLVFTKREFLIKNNIRFLPNAYYEDVAFHYSCMMKAERIMYIPQAFHVRLYREGSIMTSSLNARKICSIYEIAKELYDSLLANGLQNDPLWANYFLRLTRNLYSTVLKNVSRNDIASMKAYDKEILRLQCDAIEIYYKVLTIIDTKTSNVKRTLEYMEEIITPLGWISEDLIDVAKKIVLERENLVYKIFSSLPLNKENQRIGIYGSGKHAEYILGKYREMLGDIKADLVFIDTYKTSFSEKYNNYDIININDLPTINISEIVILSYFYEDEMYNNIVTRYGNSYKIHRIYKGEKEPLDSTTYLNQYNKLIKLYEQGRKKVILINTPLHTNVGDHMIAYATMRFFKDFMPEYDVMEVTNKRYRGNRNEVNYRINVDDIIVITGGGFLGSLWPFSGGNVYHIIEDFPENKIVILPQSMYFEDTEEGKRQKQLTYDLFTNHKDLSVCYREPNSYARSSILFEDKIKSYLMPDMALTLDYSQEQEPRNGILLCLRNDKEGMLSEDEKQSIRKHFLNLGEQVKETSMHWHTEIMPYQREEVITKKMNELKQYKLVITDALHCLISCAISGTPCIAINNISGKLEGIYRSWLNDLKYIRFVDSYNDLVCMDLDDWEELYKQNYYQKDYSQYMKQIAKIVSDE